MLWASRLGVSPLFCAGIWLPDPLPPIRRGSPWSGFGSGASRRGSRQGRSRAKGNATKDRQNGSPQGGRYKMSYDCRGHRAGPKGPLFYGLSRQGGESGGKRGGGQLLACCFPEPIGDQGHKHPGNQCPEHQQDQHHHDCGPGRTLDQSLRFIGHEAPAGKQRHRCRGFCSQERPSGVLTARGQHLPGSDRFCQRPIAPFSNGS